MIYGRRANNQTLSRIVVVLTAWTPDWDTSGAAKSTVQVNLSLIIPLGNWRVGSASRPRWLDRRRLDALLLGSSERPRGRKKTIPSAVQRGGGLWAKDWKVVT